MADETSFTRATGTGYYKRAAFASNSRYEFRRPALLDCRVAVALSCRECRSRNVSNVIL